MIKVITSFVSSLFALLLGILAIMTDYWRVWWTEAKEISAVQHYHEGLFRICHEISINGTIMTSDTCSSLHDVGIPAWMGAVIAFLVLGLISHLVAFILGAVNACYKSQPFPVTLVGVFFVIAAVCTIIALFVYTFKNWKADVFFSWSYGGGWSTVALSVIAFVLVIADR